MIKISNYQKTNIVISLVSLIIGFMIGIYIGRIRGIPFVTEKNEWSIGIYEGNSPFNFISAKNITNPVLTADQVSDVRAEYVADPFMIKDKSSWYMFFEVKNTDTKQGDIGLAISNNGFDWTYKQIVLDEPFVLSYPYVFKWEDEYYMIPESHQANSIRLYKAVDFPTKWSFVRTLLTGNYADPSILYYDGLWWLFAEANPKGEDILRLYYAQDLMGPWVEHPKSPVIDGDPNIARPGGRVIVFDGRIIRYTQDDYPTYGNQVRAFEITELSTTRYKEKYAPGNPILKGSGKGWNSIKMHNIDPHRVEKDKWIACVDGYRKRLFFGLKY